MCCINSLSPNKVICYNCHMLVTFIVYIQILCIIISFRSVILANDIFSKQILLAVVALQISNAFWQICLNNLNRASKFLLIIKAWKSKSIQVTNLFKLCCQKTSSKPSISTCALEESILSFFLFKVTNEQYRL